MQTFPLDLDTLMAFCERHAIEALRDDEHHQVVIPRPGAEGWALRAVFRPERSMATFALPLPGTIPEDRRTELARAANLLNSRTFMGAWVLNPTAGELYFRQTVGTQGVLFDDEGLKRMMQTVLGTVEVTIERLNRVLQGEPAEVVLPAAAD